MTETAPAFDAARHCDAMAASLGLTITPEQRPVVLEFLRIAHAMSEVIATAPLDGAGFELAAIFRPGAGNRENSL